MKHPYYHPILFLPTEFITSLSHPLPRYSVIPVIIIPISSWLSSPHHHRSYILPSTAIIIIIPTSSPILSRSHHHHHHNQLLLLPNAMTISSSSSLHHLLGHHHHPRLLIMSIHHHLLGSSSSSSSRAISCWWSRDRVICTNNNKPSSLPPIVYIAPRVGPNLLKRESGMGNQEFDLLNGADDYMILSSAPSIRDWLVPPLSASRKQGFTGLWYHTFAIFWTKRTKLHPFWAHSSR